MNQKVKEGFGIAGKVCSFLFRLRKIFLAVPLLAAAVYEAKKNYAALPAQVGLQLTEAGTFSKMYPKETAVWIPLIMTGACIVLMFTSRKAVYPWLIGLLTLVLPWLILMVNQFGF